ncbi:MAG TPA: hypothetical protein VKU00_01925 [Chthonomonadaceae bacterium]|nr:hypothetical protein [Chthonomonadaceae bacterium]
MTTELQYIFAILGYRDRRCKNRDLVPFGVLIETQEFILGLKIKDVAGHMGLPEAAKIAVDGSFAPIFNDITRADQEGNFINIGTSLSEILSAIDPVQVVSYEEVTINGLGFSLKVAACIEDLKREFMEAVHDVSTPIEEFLGPEALYEAEALYSGRDGEVRHADDYRELIGSA